MSDANLAWSRPDEVPSRLLRGAAGLAPALLDLTLLLSTLAVLCSLAIVALCHLGSAFQLDNVSSVHMALAAHLNHGTFYPAVYDGSHYAGTRYMPLAFAPHAGLARLTGEYVASGKLLALLLTLALAVEMVMLLRRLGCRPLVALGLVGLVLSSHTGFFAATTIRGDLLPVVCQLAALLAAWGTPSTRRVVLAALFCTLAVLGKVTAVWAGPAIVCSYLLTRDRRRAVVFLGAWLGSLGVAVLLVNVVSSGRMLANFSALSVAGVHGLGGLLKAPYQLLRFLQHGGFVLQALAPLIVLECVRVWRQRRWTACHGGLVFCLPILLVILADMGTTWNHLLDLSVLAALVAGALWASLPEADGTAWGLRGLAALFLLWGLWGSWTGVLSQRVRITVADLARGAHPYPARPLAGVIGDGETVLAEDALIPVSRGRVPVVMDFYVLARLHRARPELIRPLLRRIEGQEFAKVVLRHRVAGVDYAKDDPNCDWEDFYLGKPIARAIRAHYRLSLTAEGYDVFVPAPDTDRRLAICPTATARE